MSMVLSNKQLIHGVSPKHAREICKRCASSPGTVAELAKQFEISEVTMLQWLLLLTEAGFLIMHCQDGIILWCCSAKGAHSLVKARFGKPILGSEYVDLVFQVIERIEAYNNEPHYPFFIDAAYLFGPVITQPWLTDDPDIIIDTSIRSNIDQESNWRARYYAQYGPNRNTSYLNQLTYPDHELAVYLKKQREHINICTKDVLLPDGARLIYLRKCSDVQVEDVTQSWLSLEEIAVLGRKIDDYRERSAKTDRRQSRKSQVTDFSVIVDYWKHDYRFMKLCLPIDHAVNSCWRCGSKQELQRCHIIPDALGGPSEAANYVILCRRCHAEGPNVKDEDIMFDWIGAYRASFGSDYWTNAALAEYERIYQKSIDDEVRDVLRQFDDAVTFDRAISELKLLVNEISTLAVCHFGQTWHNNATLAGLYRIALRQLPSRLGAEEF